MDASTPQPLVYQQSYQEHNDDHDYGMRPPPGGITQQAAVEKALNYVGRVDKVKPSHGGWEIEISRGLMKGKMKVHVDSKGMVHAEKHSRMDI